MLLMAARRTFDYSRQLDLFGGLGVDSWTEGTGEAANVREKPARTDDLRTLAEAHAANGRGHAKSEPVGPDDLRSPDVVKRDFLKNLASFLSPSIHSARIFHSAPSRAFAFPHHILLPPHRWWNVLGWMI